MPDIGAVTDVYESWSAALSRADCAAPSRACAKRTPARRIGGGLRGVELLPRYDLLVGQLLETREVRDRLLPIRFRGGDLRVHDLTLARGGSHLRVRLAGHTATASDRPRGGKIGIRQCDLDPVLGVIYVNELGALLHMDVLDHANGGDITADLRQDRNDVSVYLSVVGRFMRARITPLANAPNDGNEREHANDREQNELSARRFG